jgi:hypothetical protein
MADNDYDDLLTDAERAALEDSDYMEDHQDGDGNADAALEDAAATAAAGTGGEDDLEAAASEQEQAPAPSVDIQEIDGNLTALNEEREALLEKYDDGDLTSAEYKEELNRIAEQSSELVGQRAVAQHAADQEEKQWNGAVARYMKTNPGFQESDAALKAFDGAVRMVTGNSAYAAMSYSEQLAEAHRMIAGGAVKGVPPLKGAKPAPKAEEKGEDMRTPPPSLARAPASDMSGVVDSPYAALELLIERGDSDQIEDAMRRLTPEQRDDFASRDIS